jgi:hypothetical protein
MPVDVDETTPVLIHVNPDDWEAFKKLAGRRRASMKLRAMIRKEIAAARSAKRKA